MKSYTKTVREIAKKIFALPRGTKKGKSANDFNRQEDWLKEEYIECAEEILAEAPFKCPVYECGGNLKVVIRKIPKEFEDVKADPPDYPGDEQTPDMICTNCGARYMFKGFKGED